MDTYQVDVEFVGPDEPFTARPRVTSVAVTAATENDAELAALQMVAASGRKPVRCAINWEAF